MSSSEEHIALFDAYLSGVLSAEEKHSFETALRSDKRLQHEFMQYKQLLDEIREGAEYADIRSQLNAIHNQPGITRKNFFLTPQFYVPLSLVAGFSLLLLVLNPFVREGNETADNSDYRYLKNEESSAVQNEVAETEVMDSCSEMVTEELVPGNYSVDRYMAREPSYLKERNTTPSGTAFIVSPDGYFLTSKHLVQENSTVILQQKDLGLTFEADVIYLDSLADFAILSCHPDIANQFGRIPFRFGKNIPDLGDEVFTLGFPKKEIVYNKGVVSSETGYKSDSLSFEISLPSNPGYSGAPLFTYNGELIGIINGNNLKQQSVTYVLGYPYIQSMLKELAEKDSLNIDMSNNKTKKFADHSSLVKSYRSFVFEVHLK